MALSKQINNFGVVRKAMFLQFGEQEDTRLSQFKRAPGRGKKFRPLKSIFLNDFSQTGRLGIVVSDGTILDSEVRHVATLFSIAIISKLFPSHERLESSLTKEACKTSARREFRAFTCHSRLGYGAD